MPGVGTNRYAYAENDPINKSDKSGHTVDQHDDRVYPYAELGNRTHREIFREARLRHPQARTNRTMGTFLREALGIRQSGNALRPDVILATTDYAPDGLQLHLLFEFKPVTHRDRPDLRAEDRRQVEKYLRTQEEHLVPGLPEELFPELAAGGSLQIPTTVKEAGGWEYSITLSGSDDPGVIYYELRDIGKQQTAGETVQQWLKNLSEGPKLYLPGWPRFLGSGPSRTTMKKNSTQLSLTDVPSLILRRAGPFSAVEYLPEWSFWFYVFDQCGSTKMLSVAEVSGRFFVENYPALTRPPIEYTRTYRNCLRSVGGRVFRVPAMSRATSGIK